MNRQRKIMKKWENESNENNNNEEEMINDNE